VPFPVWYPIDQEGVVRYDQAIYANSKQLPVDPLSAAPTGYQEDSRGKPGGFTGDPDVMDTWATSSLTPQIVSKWGTDKKRHQQLFPMDVRPQSHEIIRTWAFYTITKAWMHENQIPWKNVVISGWILDPDRKKMSKSKGNVVTPNTLLETYSSDAVRYWSARARLGVDTAYDEKIFKNGQKLVTKLFNASRFVLSQLDGIDSKSDLENSVVTEQLDLALLEEIRKVVEEATSALERFEYAVSLQITESAFWSFCDSYLELVKQRAYQKEDLSGYRSAQVTLYFALRAFVRLLAPVLPYVTEEIWSWKFAALEQSRSVHQASWPKASEFSDLRKPDATEILNVAKEILAGVHSVKSTAQKSLRWPLDSLEIIGAEADISRVKLVLSDLSRAARITASNVLLSEGPVGEGKRFELQALLAANEQ
jgi:valyl-tRNA synthetase